jgi:cellulose synthase/poly-beta-1,6-N-acetylglucosamine synthase-like glycosyltransferase
VYSAQRQTIPPDEILFSFAPGIARARNEMIAKYRSSFVIPLDSDDWISKRFIEKCSPVMLDDSRVGIVTTGLRWPDGRLQWPKEPFTVDHLLEENCIFGCSMFRWNAWREVGGYDEHLRTYEDWELWLRIIKAGWKVAVVQEPLFHYCPPKNCNTNKMKPGDHEEYVRYIREKHKEPALR